MSNKGKFSHRPKFSTLTKRGSRWRKTPSQTLSGPVLVICPLTRKLDNNFFAGRWARATDRQRELLSVIASLENCDEEFTVQEVSEQSKELLKKPFSPSHVSQLLATLSGTGLVYKNRHGKYSFAVPLLGRFIQ